MSSATDTHDHAHDDGAVHSHISPTWFYAAIFVALLCLTVATVAQSYLDLGGLNIALVILIASMKASLVATFFMHLKYDNKFHALIFISTIFFIGVFFAYTMNDTDRRGELDPDQNVKILPKSGEVAPGGYIAPPVESAAHEGAAAAPHH
jgi:cytochrome c oxidase subunit IV